MLKFCLMTALAAVLISLLQGCASSKPAPSALTQPCPALPGSLIKGWALAQPHIPIEQDLSDQTPRALLRRKIELSEDYLKLSGHYNDGLEVPVLVDRAYRDVLDKHPKRCGGRGPDLALAGEAGP